MPEQESVSATLADLAELASGLESPALLVVGDVVGVGATLSAASSVPRVRRSARLS